MSTKKALSVVDRFHPRPGEGHVVDVTLTDLGDGTATGSIDLGLLPVPDRRFVADSVNVMSDGLMLRLLFGQRQPVGPGLLSMVVITMAYESAEQFLDSIDDKFREQYAKSKFAGNEPILEPFAEKAEQSVVLTGSIILAGYSGSNGCLDFYFSSPFAARQVAHVKKLSIEPVVRVNLPAALLFAMLKAMAERVSATSPWRKTK